MEIYNKYIDEFEGFYTAGCTVEELNQRAGTNFVTMQHIDETFKFVLEAKRFNTIEAMKRIREMARAFRATGLVEYRHDYGCKEDPVKAIGVPIWELEELEQLIKDGELLTEVKKSLTENQKLSKETKEMLTT